MKYKVDTRVFLTLKEAIEYHNTLSLWNRDNAMFDPAKRKDTQIVSMEDSKLCPCSVKIKTYNGYKCPNCGKHYK